MNELIQRLAREAGFTVVAQLLPERPEWVRVMAGDSRIDNRLERFTALVAHECALLCEGYQDPNDGAVMADELRAAFPMPKG